MFVRTDEIKSQIKDLLKNRGFIRKIGNDKNKTVGFLIRKEHENVTEDSKSVVFNISFNSKYMTNKKKRFTLDEYKYFAIKHLNDLDTKNIELCAILNNENEDVNSIMNQTILTYIDKYINNANSLGYVDECNKGRLINFIFNSILNVKNYYKNKKIYIYFSLNF